MVSVLSTVTVQADDNIMRSTPRVIHFGCQRKYCLPPRHGNRGFRSKLNSLGTRRRRQLGRPMELQPHNSHGSDIPAMQSQWHVNMIRVFVYPSWYYRDNIVPAQEDSNYSSSTTPISTRAYLQTLCQEADKYGIYVDIVTIHADTIHKFILQQTHMQATVRMAGLANDGMGQRSYQFLQDAGYGNNEQGFWNWFWTDMANNLKDYPNAIFEAWNEPMWAAT